MIVSVTCKRPIMSDCLFIGRLVLFTHHLAIGSGLGFQLLVVSVVGNRKPVAELRLLDDRHVTLAKVLDDWLAR